MLACSRPLPAQLPLVSADLVDGPIDGSMDLVSVEVGARPGTFRASQLRKHARSGRRVVFVERWPEDWPHDCQGSGNYARVVALAGGRPVCRLLAPRCITAYALRNAVWQHLAVPVEEREIMLRASEDSGSERPLANADLGIATFEIEPHFAAGDGRAPWMPPGSSPSSSQGGTTEPPLGRHAAAREGSTDDAMAAAVAGGWALHRAVLEGDLEACGAILSHGTFGALAVNARDQHGRTPLHLAAACGYSNVCIGILRHPGFAKAAATLLDVNGCSAFDLASPAVREELELLPVIRRSYIGCGEKGRLHVDDRVDLHNIPTANEAAYQTFHAG